MLYVTYKDKKIGGGYEEVKGEKREIEGDRTLDLRNHNPTL